MRKTLALMLALVWLGACSLAATAQEADSLVQAETFFERYNRMIAGLNQQLHLQEEPWIPVFHQVAEAPDLLLTRLDREEFSVDLSIFSGSGVIRQLIYRMEGDDTNYPFLAHLTSAMFGLSQGEEALERLDALSLSMGGQMMEMLLRWRMRVNGYQLDIVDQPPEGDTSVTLFVFRYMKPEPQASDLPTVKSLIEYNAYFEGLSPEGLRIP